jgi:hypothetical protein
VATNRRLLVETIIKSQKSKEERKIKILIDTGAEVNLIRPGLFQDEAFERAAQPLRLITVSGEPLSGEKRLGTSS